MKAVVLGANLLGRQVRLGLSWSRWTRISWASRITAPIT
jgi:hypothetical protein